MPRPPSLVRELRAALRAQEREPQDRAAIALALQYARLIDLARDVDTLNDLGPKLTTVLIELGMTPRARAGVLRHMRAPEDSPDDELAQLRAARQRHTQAMDAPSS